MRVVVLGAGVLLAGCVQQGYVPPPPIELQAYPPPIPYRYDPSLRAPGPAPLAEPLPAPNSLGEPPAANDQAPTDDTGAIPLQQMPAPAPDTPTAGQPGAGTTLTPAAPAPAVPATPAAGPGSNVPLEGFRPMHSQTRPAP